MSKSYLCIVPDFPNTVSTPQLPLLLVIILLTTTKKIFFFLYFIHQVEARLKVRSAHLANVLASDRLDLAGALAPEFPAAEGVVPDFKGSAVIVRAENRDDAIAFLKQDVYVSEGVWDVANAQVFAVSLNRYPPKKKDKKELLDKLVVIPAAVVLLILRATVLYFTLAKRKKKKT